MTEPAAAAAPSTMRRDIASAYVVTAARVLSWFVVSAVVYRELGAEAFAMLALVRATVGLLGYVSLGLGPAMVRLLSAAEREPAPVAAIPIAPANVDTSTEAVPTPLAYASGVEPPSPNATIARIYSTGEGVALVLAGVGLALAAVYALNYGRLHEVPAGMLSETRTLAILFGVGIVLRVLSEAPAGLLQVRGRIALDNLLLAVAEIAWAIGTTVSFLTDTAGLVVVGTWFAMSNLVLLGARAILGRMEVRTLTSSAGVFDRTVAGQLLSFGVLVAFAQLADFLYAPVDYILINRFIDPAAVAVYAPAVQIDGGLLLLVVAVSTVLLPRTAVAHAAGDVPLVRRYYVRATLLTGAILLAAAVAVALLSRWIFRLWLGDDMPETRAILPLVLIHTVVGGSSAVGRSILIGIGKVKPFTISVLVTGAANVVLGYVFVRHLNLGLRGIVYATVIVVVARAGIWMPWYVIRTLRRMESQPAAGAAPVDASTM